MTIATVLVTPTDGFSAGQDFQSDSARYRVIERLGRGGNSDVYLVQATSGIHKGLLLAAKLMTRIDRPDRVARFRAELNYLTDLTHPGVMKVYDSGTHVFGPPADRREVPFYIAEYLPKMLKDAMRSGLLMVDKISIGVQLVSTLVFLASQNPQIIHRDLKPENIFIRGRTPVIGDFGLMKALGPEGVVEAFAMGELSAGIRFPRLYPTPELIAYAKDESVELTPKSDVFQLGIVLAEVFCDTFPIEDRSQPLDPIVLRTLPEIGGAQGVAIRGAIIQMLTLDPAKRPMPEETVDLWDGAFREIIADARRVEGRAFC